MIIFIFANVALYAEDHMEESASPIPAELQMPPPPLPPPKKTPHMYFSYVGSFKTSSEAPYHHVTT